VRDLAFNLIGHVALNPATEDNFFGVAKAVSPDGTRAYVLAYEENELVVPTPQFTPRVYVFDLTTPGLPDQRMPLLGYFAVADYPTCLRFSDCSLSPATTISMDGNTLFFAGSRNLLIVPIPDEGTLIPASVPAPAQKRTGTRSTVRWDLRLAPQ
jgi:hypothetical protein